MAATPRPDNPREGLDAEQRAIVWRMILRALATIPSGPGGPPTGPAGGDLSGTYPNPSVVDDSHNHTAATVTGSFPPNGPAGGDLSGTYPSPQVVDDSHNHTAATLPASFPPSGPAGGDLSGTYPNPSVVDDSHNHTNATVTGPFPPNGPAGGDLSGTYPNPSVVDDSHSHTSATVTGPFPPNGPAGGDLRGTYPNPVVHRASEDFALTGDIAATVAAVTHNWAPAGLATASRINVTVTGAARSITGLTGGADGRVVILHCLAASSFGFMLLPENSNSTAANRFSIETDPLNPLCLVSPGGSVALVYNSTISRWTYLSHGLPLTHSATHAFGGTDPLIAGSVPLTVLENQATQTLVGRGDAGAGPVSPVTFSDTGIAISTSEVLSISGRLRSQQVFTSGSGTYTKPAGINLIRVRLIGGGGGGGGAQDGAAGTSSAGGGGGAGSYGEKVFTAPAASYSYAVGAGGAGGAGTANGTAGGASTFDTMNGPGGTGGLGATASAINAFINGGASTPSTNCDINAAGSCGFEGTWFAAGGPCKSGSGGNSVWGGGGEQRVNNTTGGANGVAGDGIGAGGGGATVCNGGAASDRTGGAGTDGIVVVDEYS